MHVSILVLFLLCSRVEERIHFSKRLFSVHPAGIVVFLNAGEANGAFLLKRFECLFPVRPIVNDPLPLDNGQSAEEPVLDGERIRIQHVNVVLVLPEVPGDLVQLLLEVVNRASHLRPPPLKANLFYLK